MNFKINETGELKELKRIDAKSGEDMARSIIDNSGTPLDEIGYDAEDDVYTTSQANYEWWERYMADAEADDAKINELFKTYGYEAYDILFEEMASSDYEDHHSANLRAFERIENELNAN